MYHGTLLGGHRPMLDTDTIQTLVRLLYSKRPTFFNQCFRFGHSGDNLKNAPDTIGHMENK